MWSPFAMPCLKPIATQEVSSLRRIGAPERREGAQRKKATATASGPCRYSLGSNLNEAPIRCSLSIRIHRSMVHYLIQRPHLENQSLQRAV